MIIDCHVHVNLTDDESQQALPGQLEALRREMTGNRVDAALILTSAKVLPGWPSTAQVVSAIRGDPRLAVVAGISPFAVRPKDLVALRALVEEGIVRGLKLYPGYEPFYPNDAALEPVYRFAAEHQIPVMVHCGDTYAPGAKLKYAQPLHVDDAATDHPEVNFVICHLGTPWFRDTMEVVYKNANVYTDISGLVLGNFSDRFERYMRDRLQEMLLYGVESSRVLFGSNWPSSSMRSYLEFMEELRIPPDDRERIMSGNAQQLFRFPQSGGASAASAFRDWLHT